MTRTVDMTVHSVRRELGINERQARLIIDTVRAFEKKLSRSLPLDVELQAVDVELGRRIWAAVNG